MWKVNIFKSMWILSSETNSCNFKKSLFKKKSTMATQQQSQNTAAQQQSQIPAPIARMLDLEEKMRQEPFAYHRCTNCYDIFKCVSPDRPICLCWHEPGQTINGEMMLLYWCDTLCMANDLNGSESDFVDFLGDGILDF
jgi:hypothetical protein